MFIRFIGRKYFVISSIKWMDLKNEDVDWVKILFLCMLFSVDDFLNGFAWDVSSTLLVFFMFGLLSFRL